MTAPALLDVDDLGVSVAVRRSRRARRIGLRVDPGARQAVLTLPAGASLDAGLTFVRAKADWLRARLAHLPAAKPFADGSVIPVLGVDHVVRHRPEARRGVWREAGAINVSGTREHLERRLADWLKDEAKREIAARAVEKAARIDRRPAGVSVRDTRSRWGSCSVEGRLNFSWRLILAPAPVLDYVIAHEVAHLAEMNHGPAFWRLVGELTDHAETGKRWLRQHGERLHAYGANT